MKNALRRPKTYPITPQHIASHTRITHVIPSTTLLVCCSTRSDDMLTHNTLTTPSSRHQHLPTCTPRTTCFISRVPSSPASSFPSAPRHHHSSSATRREVLLATAAASAMGTQPITTTSGKLDTHDLLIVGPGVLGSYLGAQWKGAHAGATVVAQTNTTNNHPRYAVLYKVLRKIVHWC